MGMKLTGDWKKLTTQFRAAESRIDRVLQRGLRRSGLKVEREIVKGIQKQKPIGGKRFTTIHEFTAKMKKSSKALVDRADLMNSITSKMVSRTSVFVGVLKKTKNKEGEWIVNIAEMMEGGAVLKMKPEMQRWLGAHGFYQTSKKPTSKVGVITIPKRPFIAPVVKSKEVEESVGKIMRENLADLFG